MFFLSRTFEDTHLTTFSFMLPSLQVQRKLKITRMYHQPREARIQKLSCKILEPKSSIAGTNLTGSIAVFRTTVSNPGVFLTICFGFVRSHADNSFFHVKCPTVTGRCNTVAILPVPGGIGLRHLSLLVMDSRKSVRWQMNYTTCLGYAEDSAARSCPPRKIFQVPPTPHRNAQDQNSLLETVRIILALFLIGIPH